MMGAVDKFLYKLENFDKENIPSKVIKALQQYLNVRIVIRDTHLLRPRNEMREFRRLHLQDAEFDPQKILAKSTAASGLCAWVINIHNFYNVFLVVEPKKRALVDAQNELQAAQDKLNYLNSKILVNKKQFQVKWKSAHTSLHC